MRAAGRPGSVEGALADFDTAMHLCAAYGGAVERKAIAS